MPKCKKLEHCEAAGRLTPAELDELAELLSEKLIRKMANRPKYLSKDAMAAELGICVPTLDRWRRNGVIPCIKADKGRVLFDPAQVHEALRNRSDNVA